MKIFALFPYLEPEAIDPANEFKIVDLRSSTLHSWFDDHPVDEVYTSLKYVQDQGSFEIAVIDIDLELLAKLAGTDLDITIVRPAPVHDSSYVMDRIIEANELSLSKAMVENFNRDYDKFQEAITEILPAFKSLELIWFNDFKTFPSQHPSTSKSRLYDDLRAQGIGKLGRRKQNPQVSGNG